MSNSNAPAASFRTRLRQHLVERVKLECDLLESVGAPRKELEPFIKKAERFGSPRIFTKLAEYTEQKMPALLANRENWSLGLRHYSVLIVKMPDDLREATRTISLDFAGPK